MVFSAFWAQIRLWGLDPFGFHLVNIFIHICNALLLWRCLEKLAIPGAFWAACIFAVHPVHVESVAWVTELKNVLSAFFYLLAFLSYWRFSELQCSASGCRNTVWMYYVTALILFCFALLSKTVTCTLPAVILLLFWWKRGRVEWREGGQLLPFFIWAFILGLLTLRLETDHLMAKGPEWDFSIVERFLIAGRVLWFYAGKLLWPYPLIFNYPRWHIDASAWWQYLFPVGAIVVIAVLWRYKGKTGRGPLVACLFFIGSHFPVLGFMNVYWMRFSFVADHFQYIASFSLIVIFCFIIRLLTQKFCKSFKYAETTIFVVILLALSALTWQQGKIYNSRLALFNDTIGKNPASWLSYSNRAVDYTQSGRDDLAMADLDKALELNPNEADALQTRGVINLKRKHFAEAFADFDRSIAIRPWRIDYWKNRCLANRVTGKFDAALADAGRIIAMDPGDVENHLLRASIYALRDESASALRDLESAMKITPDDFRIYANRGLLYYRKNLLSQSIADYDMAIRLNPDSAETYFNRGLTKASAGAHSEARTDFIKARQLGYQISDELLQNLSSNRSRQ
jgi:tetratricopeptide (TPR) repeat protein